MNDSKHYGPRQFSDRSMQGAYLVWRPCEALVSLQSRAEHRAAKVTFRDHLARIFSRKRTAAGHSVAGESPAPGTETKTS